MTPRLLDTDVLVDYQRGYAPVHAWFASLSELPSVPGLVIMELIQDAQNTRQIRAVQKMVAPLPVVWPTEVDCRRALRDFAAFHPSHRLGLIDALIAACAVGQGAILCTFNIKHYRVVSELVTNNLTAADAARSRVCLLPPVPGELERRPERRIR